MKAMILAAGRGERMGPLTHNCPKPLLHVAHKPLLQHHLERLLAAGFNQVVINAAYLAEQIQRFVEQEYMPHVAGAMEVQVSVEADCLETGGGIHNALPLLGDQPFVVINGDVWTDYPLQQLPRTLAGLGHLVLVNNPQHNPNGDFSVSEQGMLANLPASNGAAALTFSGISVLAPELFRDCEPGRFGLAPLLRQAAQQQQMSAEHYRGYWQDVGTPQRLAAVETRIQENRQ